MRREIDGDVQVLGLREGGEEERGLVSQRVLLGIQRFKVV